MERDRARRPIRHPGRFDVPSLREQRAHDVRKQVRGQVKHLVVGAEAPFRSEAQAVQLLEQVALRAGIATDDARGVDRSNDGVRRGCRDLHPVIVEEHLGLEPIRTEPRWRQSQPRARPSVLDRDTQILGHVREGRRLREERVDQGEPAVQRHGDRPGAPERGEPHAEAPP